MLKVISDNMARQTGEKRTELQSCSCKSLPPRHPPRYLRARTSKCAIRVDFMNRPLSEVAMEQCEEQPAGQ